MNRLKVPLVLSRLDINRDHGISVEIRTFAVAPIKVASRRSKGQVDQTALLIDRKVKWPRVGAGPVPPTIAIPRVVAGLARLRDGAELPQFRASAGVVCSGVSGRAEGSGWGIGANHDHIFRNQRNRGERNNDVDFAFLAEAGVELASGCI